MPTSFTLFGFTFYLYGLLIGLAMIVSAKIAEQRLKAHGLNGEAIWEVALVIVTCGLIGARAWHIATDWFLYQDNWLTALYIWNGGLSILGGLLGGLTGVWLSRNNLQRQGISWPAATDALVVGLPFGQALGRLGNWINQELYGYPTQLPWKLYIDPQYRVKGFETVDYFHPLFAYEAIALLIIGGLLFWMSEHKKTGLGKGVMTMWYVLLYSLTRFFLEFLRIEKTTIDGTRFGVNQVVLAVVALVIGVLLIKKYLSTRQEQK